MLLDIILFVFSLIVVTKSATVATTYASKLADSFRLSKYIVGFFVVAVISILPETLIAIQAALQGTPEFGLGTLLGSNVADLTFVFALIIFLTNRGIKIESHILKNNSLYPFILLLPLLLGLDGYYSRLEGVVLVLIGLMFYAIIFKKSYDTSLPILHEHHRVKYGALLLVAMLALLAASYATVHSATSLAGDLGISPILIGMLVVALGTTMPELFFSLRSHREHNDALAAGDILGTVLSDATIVVGILALISPFAFPERIIYVTGGFMVMGSILLLLCMRSGRILSKKEAYLLMLFYIAFVLTEFFLNS